MRLTLFVMSLCCWSAQADEFTRMPPGFDPVPPGLVLPEHPPADAGFATEQAGAKPNKVDAPAAERTAQGQRALRRVAAFLGAQETIAVTVQQHLHEQGTMGFIRGDARYDVALGSGGRFASVRNAAWAPDERWEIRSNGEHFMRVLLTRVMVEPAPPSVAALLATKAAQPIDVWKLDTPRLLALFDPDGLEALLESCRVDYRGEVTCGAATLDHVVLDSGGEDRAGRGFRWDVYLSRGETPVPVRIVPSRDGAFSSLKGAERFTASDLRLTNWAFNAPATEERFRLVMPDMELVNSFDRLTRGEVKAVNPMVGRPMPDLELTDLAGQTFTSKQLLGGRPVVLVVAPNSSVPLAWWRFFSAVEERFAEQGVKVVVLDASGQTSNDVRKALRKTKQYRLGLSPPTILLLRGDVSGLADGVPNTPRAMMFSRRAAVSGDSPAPRVGSVMQPYVVDATGKIQHVARMTNDITTELIEQIEGVLAGRDMAAENAASIAAQEEARKQRLATLKQAFASQGTGTAAPYPAGEESK